MEVSLWFEEGAHVITMSSKILGPFAKCVAWLLYLFICYGSLVAYTSGGGVQVGAVMQEFFGFTISKDVGCLLFALIFGGVIYLGSYFVGKVNTILFVAMVLAYFALLGIGVSEVKLDLLRSYRWRGAALTIPMMLTSFSFQTMVPSLTPFLKRHVNALRWAIVGGTTIAFVVYLAWQGFFFGIVPSWGPGGLVVALEKGEPPIKVLQVATQSIWVAHIAEYFAFFALVTSFLGIALGLFDFLSDGFKVKQEGFGKAFLWLLMLVPTLFLAIKFERAFVVAIETTGGIGDSLLNGIIPVLMVWVGRYRMGMQGPYRMSGGRLLLAGLFVFYLFVFILELLVCTGVVTPTYNIERTLDF